MNITKSSGDETKKQVGVSFCLNSALNKDFYPFKLSHEIFASLSLK
jgi:hypothetical protein